MIFKSAGYAVGLVLTTTTVLFGAEPVLWLDASQNETLMIQDGRVKTWSHRGSRAFQVSQSERQRQPQLGDKLNGHPTLTFDGNDYLQGSAVLATGDDSFTMIALWRPHRIAIQSVFEQAGPGRGGRAALLQVNKAYGFNGQSNDFHSAVTLAPNQWRLTAMVITGSKRDNVIVLDNEAQPVVGTIDVNAQNIGADRIQIGKKIFGGEFYQGDLAELRVFDAALSQKELEQQLAGIKKHWGLKFESVVPKIPRMVDGQPIATNPTPTAEQVEFFENQVRPLLARHCYECHSGKSKKLQGGLRLDGRALAIKGGDSGAAIVPG
ncbi:MAG: hypothetical protein KDA84_09705, partial [Planctomycetaceae bacterium]|nr:hypothetical protein [Planctomycetaceae bacterium]